MAVVALQYYVIFIRFLIICEFQRHGSFIGLQRRIQACNFEQFPCSNGMCISNDWRCDGDDDCSDGGDEVECDSSASGSYEDSNECGGIRGVDFNQDCHHCINEDPGYRCRCDAGYREDNTNAEGNCVDVNECDGKRGVDYNQDCHRCINAVPGYTCECDEGFVENNAHVEGSCVDIDECLGERGVDYDRDCHKCINTNGSHTCGCDSGYELHLNGTSCVGDEKCQRAQPWYLLRKMWQTMNIQNHEGSNIQDSQSDKTKPKATLSKTTKTMANNSDGKLGFAQVDGFRGKWSFLAFQCPKGSDAVEKFWKLVNDRTIQSVVLLEDVSSKVLPAGGSVGSFNDIKVICKEEWQKRGIKKFTVTLSDEQLCGEAEYANQLKGISVLTVDHEPTNEDIISLRQNLISSERSPTCAIMCKDGQQFSGFFISVNCMLDMVDEGNRIDIVQGLQQFKTVRPDFAPTDEQILQLSHLAKDYGSYGKELK
ncbi:hypothetical protein CAPTEDRAFT_188609 [Capitella teleta]|uniref:Tyrosine-protein phosphatase domain-containing protein n=1 Tax=Capitella teleta TaxID=283909 RepID=R7TAE3_CAPTE|nr:hypothetical protein CAPTEDRAFT_188609 [Capitella teleta]|eukprot:ELT88447.1 hypothetical protein CAPTEDRAFT_188609 [Capitella teleta]